MTRPLPSSGDHFGLRDRGYVHSPENDIWATPGFVGTTYSDGESVEERIAAIVAGAKDLTLFSRELSRQCSDWPSLYHLSGCRANIMRPFCGGMHGNILEIGSGCGAITRFLGESGANVLALEGSRRRAAITRSRTRDLQNVAVVCDNFNDFQTDQRFDMITLIGVLEYAGLYMLGPTPFKALLEKARGLLTVDGSLVIAIENQLGLKYFAGYPEDHLGRLMHGVEGRYGMREPKTFGRKALVELLSSAGFMAHELMVPFPDYKFAASIVTDAGFNAEDFDASAFAWQSVRRDPQMPPRLHFVQELAWPVVIGNGLGPDLANSFLIRATPVASNASSDLAYHYSTQRAPQYCKETHFRRRPDGSVGVFTRRLGNQTIEGGKDFSFSTTPEADYVLGPTLAFDFVRILTSEGWRMEDVAEFFRSYRSALIEVMGQMGLEAKNGVSGVDICVPGSMLDVLPHNIVRCEDGSLYAIDIEWSSASDLDFRYLVFRSIMVLLGLVAYVGKPASGVMPTYGDFVSSLFAMLGLPCTSGDLDALAADDARMHAAVGACAASGNGRGGFWWKDIRLPAGDRIDDLRRSFDDLRLRHEESQEHARGLEERLIAEQKALDMLVHSRSWRLTAPLRFATTLARAGLKLENARSVTQALRAWYHRMPLPAGLKTVLRQFYHHVLRKHINRLRHMKGGSVFVPPDFRPAERGDSPDYIVWGVIDWHFRHQRPQQLALAIAKTGRRVFYISPDLTDSPVPGFSAEPIDSDGRIIQVKLNVSGINAIYHAAPETAVVTQLRHSIGEVLRWAECGRVVSVVDHPFWHEAAFCLPNGTLVYDCMDHHEGFGNNGSSLIELERMLLSEADLVVVTSGWLDDAVANSTKRRALIRNACDYEHFAHIPAEVHRDQGGRPILGYFGAIAEWMDLDLLEAVAKRFSDCLLLLIGADTVNARAKLSSLPNVRFTGEIPYHELPGYLHGFDVCLFPFKVIPLTIATNPVKIYEYLSAGKQVVAIDLPEMSQFEGLVEVANGQDEFLQCIEKALRGRQSVGEVERRQAFARGQTWTHRAVDLLRFAESDEADPSVSVIVVTYNNLNLTKACLQSLEENNEYERLEIIVVDNASSDETPAFLKNWASGFENRKLILNQENRGFSAANNQGLAMSTGDFLVLLNNDTVVTRGWVRTLIRHLQRDKTIGLIGPVTNNIGNEARIEIAYNSMEEMHKTTFEYTRQHVGETFPLSTVAFFCVMLSRPTYELVGPLDEAFGIGFFEDDDYCRRVEQIGLRVVCAADVFIHHHLSASFDMLKQEKRQKLFEDNKVLYERKWGPWIPHSYVKGDWNIAAPSLAEPLRGQSFLSGTCSVCGKLSNFYYQNSELGSKSLICQHCKSSCQDRLAAAGILRAIEELNGVKSSSLAGLPSMAEKSLRVCDTLSKRCECTFSFFERINQIEWLNLIPVSLVLSEMPSVSEGGVCDIILASEDSCETVSFKQMIGMLGAGGRFLFLASRERGFSSTTKGDDALVDAFAQCRALFEQDGLDIDVVREGNLGSGVGEVGLIYSRKRD
jgi:GT2 family glycosyltransferase